MSQKPPSQAQSKGPIPHPPPSRKEEEEEEEEDDFDVIVAAIDDIQEQLETLGRRVHSMDVALTHALKGITLVMSDISVGASPDKSEADRRAALGRAQHVLVRLAKLMNQSQQKTRTDQ